MSTLVLEQQETKCTHPTEAAPIWLCVSCIITVYDLMKLKHRREEFTRQCTRLQLIL